MKLGSELPNILWSPLIKKSKSLYEKGVSEAEREVGLKRWVDSILQGLISQVWPLHFVVIYDWNITGGLRQVSDRTCLCLLPAHLEFSI